MCTIQIQKEKILFFCEKKKIWISSIFFQRGDPSIKKIFFSVTKKFQKQISKMNFLGPFGHRKEQSQEF